jgi:predicted HTH transcriptional regulator
MEKILEFIKQGEGINVEFKEAKNKLNKDIFETNTSLYFQSVNVGINDTNVGINEQIEKYFFTKMKGLSLELSFELGK